MLFLDRYAPAVPYTVAMSLGPGVDGEGGRDTHPAWCVCFALKLGRNDSFLSRETSWVFSETAQSVYVKYSWISVSDSICKWLLRSN